jgi:hypothetical protein
VDRQQIDSASYASPSLVPQRRLYGSLLVEALPLAEALHENCTVSDTTLLHSCPDGMERLITWDVAPIRSASAAIDGVDGIVAVGRDVTEERRQRERSLAAVARAMASAPDIHGLNARVSLILTALAENTSRPMLTGALYLLSGVTGKLERVAMFGQARSGVAPPAIPVSPRHPWWHVLIAGPLYSSPDGVLPPWLGEIGRGMWTVAKIRAWATLPIQVKGTVVGALSVGLSVPMLWNADERSWIESCRDAIATGIQVDRLFAAERRQAKDLEGALRATAEERQTNRAPTPPTTSAVAQEDRS